MGHRLRGRLHHDGPARPAQPLGALHVRPHRDVSGLHARAHPPILPARPPRPGT